MAPQAKKKNRNSHFPKALPWCNHGSTRRGGKLSPPYRHSQKGLVKSVGFFSPSRFLCFFFFFLKTHTSITAVTTGINFFCRGGHGREENLKNLTAVKFCIDHGREVFPRFLLVSSFSFVDRARPPFPSHSWGGKSNIKSVKKNWPHCDREADDTNEHLWWSCPACDAIRSDPSFHSVTTADRSPWPNCVSNCGVIPTALKDSIDATSSV